VIVAAPNTNRLLRRLADLARSALGTTEFIRATCETLATAVAYDFACLATTDPATGLITGTVKSHPGDSMDEQLARYEYEAIDLNQFVELARRPVPVGVLELDTDGHPDRSLRYRDFLLPQLALGHELRAVFRSAGATWGAIGLYRSAGSPGFATAEIDAVAAVTGVIADGIRAALISTPVTSAQLSDAGPAVLVLGPDDRPRLITPLAEDRVGELGGTIHGALPMPLLALAAATRAASRNGAPTPAATRIRTPDGWISARAAPVASSGEVVISLDQAGPPEIVPIIAAGYGLTNREQDVTRLVLLGADTATIASQLFLSPYTVQDHLKSIFRKVGVNNRRQLTATIFFQQYAPRIGGPLNADGWFATPRSELPRSR
jgi:DNA-binding CsgD family transcriptional regulator